MIQSFIYKNLEKVPNTYKCLFCLQIPQNPLFDTKCQFLFCKKCFLYNLSELQIQLLNSIKIKCEYCQKLIQGKKLQKHSYQCMLSIKTEQQIYIEQQLFKSHQDFKCNKCQNVSINQFICKICKNIYCIDCSSRIFCCNKIIDPTLSLEFNISISKLISQCILCDRQFNLKDIFQHIIECPCLIVKCHCGNSMTRTKYQQHLQSCLTKLIEQHNRNMSTALSSIEIMSFFFLRGFNTQLFQAQYIEHLYPEDYSTSGIIINEQ